MINGFDNKTLILIGPNYWEADSCRFITSWYYIKRERICTTGQVIKVNHIYTYEDIDQIDIVRLADIYFKRGYLY